MSSATIRNDPTQASFETLPPLESGDRLTPVEFERRYRAMQNVKRAELIEGIVFMPSPVSQDYHAKQQTLFSAWLGFYWDATPGVEAGTDATVRLDLENVVQPDGILKILPPKGRVLIEPGGFNAGSPELIAEVSSSSVSIDLGQKYRVYQRNGVMEYVVWRVREHAIDWFLNVDGEFRPLEASEGTFKSRTFPGLWLDRDAMLGLQLKKVIATLNEGLQSAEHAAFIESLRS